MAPPLAARQPPPLAAPPPATTATTMLPPPPPLRRRPSREGQRSAPASGATRRRPFALQLLAPALFATVVSLGAGADESCDGVWCPPEYECEGGGSTLCVPVRGTTSAAPSNCDGVVCPDNYVCSETLTGTPTCAWQAGGVVIGPTMSPPAGRDDTSDRTDAGANAGNGAGVGAGAGAGGVDYDDDEGAIGGIDPTMVAFIGVASGVCGVCFLVCLFFMSMTCTKRVEDKRSKTALDLEAAEAGARHHHQSHDAAPRLHGTHHHEGKHDGHHHHHHHHRHHEKGVDDCDVDVKHDGDSLFDRMKAHDDKQDSKGSRGRTSPSTTPPASPSGHRSRSPRSHGRTGASANGGASPEGGSREVSPHHSPRSPGRSPRHGAGDDAGAHVGHRRTRSPRSPRSQPHSPTSPPVPIDPDAPTYGADLGSYDFTNLRGRRSPRNRGDSAPANVRHLVDLNNKPWEVRDVPELVPAGHGPHRMGLEKHFNDDP